jgi:hypothetical protein
MKPRMATMTITTISSMRVKPASVLLIVLLLGDPQGGGMFSFRVPGPAFREKDRLPQYLYFRFSAERDRRNAEGRITRP